MEAYSQRFGDVPSLPLLHGPQSGHAPSVHWQPRKKLPFLNDRQALRFVRCPGSPSHAHTAAALVCFPVLTERLSLATLRSLLVLTAGPHTATRRPSLPHTPACKMFSHSGAEGLADALMPNFIALQVCRCALCGLVGACPPQRPTGRPSGRGRPAGVPGCLTNRPVELVPTEHTHTQVMRAQNNRGSGTCPLGLEQPAVSILGAAAAWPSHTRATVIRKN